MAGSYPLPLVLCPRGRVASLLPYQTGCAFTLECPSLSLSLNTPYSPPVGTGCSLTRADFTGQVGAPAMPPPILYLPFLGPVTVGDGEREGTRGWEEWERFGVEQGVFMKVVTTPNGGVTNLSGG